ncbi:MAG: hypothetical protein AAGE90_20195 [Pseudomonadota bacterium]
MANWRALHDHEWQAHPLNRVGGLLGVAVAALIVLHIGFHAALALVMQEALTEGMEPLPEVAGATLWAFPAYAALSAGATLAVLWSIWTRWLYAPELNIACAVTLAIADRAQVYVDGLPLFGESSEEIALFLGAHLLTAAFAVYLFIGKRPNIMFRRRERVD